MLFWSDIHALHSFLPYKGAFAELFCGVKNNLACPCKPYRNEFRISVAGLFQFSYIDDVMSKLENVIITRATMTALPVQL